jgi:hypothetical protein
MLNMRQNSILLGFVKAMNFVNEHDGELSAAFCLFHRLAQIGNSSSDGAQPDEACMSLMGNDLCQGRFPATWWAPENH